MDSNNAKSLVRWSTFLLLFSTQEGSNLGMNCSVKTMSECNSFICCRNWKLYSDQSRRLKEEEDKVVFLIKSCILPEACDTITTPQNFCVVQGKSLKIFLLPLVSTIFLSFCVPDLRSGFSFIEKAKPSHLFLHILCKRLYTCKVESWVSWVGHPS